MDVELTDVTYCCTSILDILRTLWHVVLTRRRWSGAGTKSSPSLWAAKKSLHVGWGISPCTKTNLRQASHHISTKN